VAQVVLGGILPFGACFVELFFILSSMWMDQYYYVFGFTLLVFVILLVTCAEVTVVLVYFQVQTVFSLIPLTLHTHNLPLGLTPPLVYRSTITQLLVSILS